MTTGTLRLILFIALGVMLLIVVIMLLVLFARRKREENADSIPTPPVHLPLDEDATIGGDWKDEEATIGAEWQDAEATIGGGWDADQTIATDWNTGAAYTANDARSEAPMERSVTRTPDSLHGVDLEETIALNQWQPKAELRFTVEEEDHAYETTIRFASSMSIGREKTCDLCLTEPYVSRQHLLITRMGKTLTVANLAFEKAGEYTLLNGQSISDQAVLLNDGDTLEIADVRMTLHVIRL